MAKKKPGLPPGSLVYVGEQKTDRVRLTLIDYDRHTFTERELTAIEDAFPSKDKPTVSWLNIDGLHQVEILEKLGNHFDIHSLVLEDILNTGQRPKVEEFPQYLFISLKMLEFDNATTRLRTEQISLIAGTNFVLSFQETHGDCFEPVRARLRSGRARIRSSGSDYLVYALVDAIVDHYFVILEKLGERIAALEEELIANPTRGELTEIHHLKRELLILRKTVWPLREVVGTLERGESPLIHKQTRPFLRDLYDHTIQVIETGENFRDTVSGLLDIYLSSISNRTNDVMKVLTMIATIFIPLSFLAGLYGMNFEHMPELHSRWGYPVVLLVMLAVGIGLLIFFKRKKWL